MVRHHVAVVRELFVADCAFSVLFNNLPVQEFPHLGWRSEFSIPSGVMWVFYPLDTEPHFPALPRWLPPAAKARPVDRAIFIATQSHVIPPAKSLVVWLVVVNSWRKEDNRGWLDALLEWGYHRAGNRD
jgi:hypothetical protein